LIGQIEVAVERERDLWIQLFDFEHFPMIDWHTRATAFAKSDLLNGTDEGRVPSEPIAQSKASTGSLGSVPPVRWRGSKSVARRQPRRGSPV